ncbi:MAG: hypothetical protein ACE361_26385 [Aureliella sp.]
MSRFALVHYINRCIFLRGGSDLKAILQLDVVQLSLDCAPYAHARQPTVLHAIYRYGKVHASPASVTVLSKAIPELHEAHFLCRRNVLALQGCSF